ncbi:hypothetical protein R69658_04016 [Paraburkholderia aspalathi]|uniref:Uncharacterized protein n=2 Tax=Burkholderiaceae TaxID=119060 RepID=A0A1I7ENG7_9BURK|nr:hypothetical protein [Paraburkholderia aspalathi]CAE6769702.1 hypothetical protein R75465_03541 [Paraburkholderia aspalathi]CAE6771681.1 hypothetical protein R20943_03850 [Paraburkholderia aspalathi]CAE6779814.1 hypothetical protein R69658_04016 [Paraburkholderia aspalathi]SFU25478.1 hypothetical protein SAMN05192563_103719 [Paraburkholderia aspalathi]
MQCRAMHLTGCVDRPSTGAFAERFMSSASSVLPTADCVIYYLLTACLLFACRFTTSVACRASLLFDERRNVDFVSLRRSSTSLMHHFYQAC